MGCCDYARAQTKPYALLADLFVVIIEALHRQLLGKRDHF
jgi:hypothetical protein